MSERRRIRPKAECEKEFVDYLLSIGITGHTAMEERRKCYYAFWLNNGELRYWKDMSIENLKRLGIETNE